ncbi:MAG: hypothetical protein AAGC81_09865 [Pseudomonadota bacterium]
MSPSPEQIAAARTALGEMCRVMAQDYLTRLDDELENEVDEATLRKAGGRTILYHCHQEPFDNSLISMGEWGLFEDISGDEVWFCPSMEPEDIPRFFQSTMRLETIADTLSNEKQVFKSILNNFLELTALYMRWNYSVEGKEIVPPEEFEPLKSPLQALGLLESSGERIAFTNFNPSQFIFKMEVAEWT